ncbi:unnamed protein product [Adineta steineri]|uniref:Uncharacterized protein n=1 Tax=Adineta steineri TaxID=433720 RepID=A0A820EQV7_9BILA|nr:unnamed protein product [Adineta steineri]CAF4250576.1 unnamed protein product [Adineta steineri]
MGACIGKKRSEYLKHNQIKSDTIQAPQPKLQDDDSSSKPSPSLSKKLQMVEDLSNNNNNDDENRLSSLDENSIDPEVQMIIEGQNLINEIFNQAFSNRVVSITDSVLECELVNLIYGYPAIDYIENPSITTTIKPVDV